MGTVVSSYTGVTLTKYVDKMCFDPDIFAIDCF
jgi:hypothetical protein